MRTIRIVSKPVAPPWNDASKNLVHMLLTHARVHGYRFWGTADSTSLESATVRCDAIHGAPGRFEPGLVQNVRPFLHLLAPDRDVDAYHYLFTPNARTSRMLGALSALKRRPSVHTLCSAPRQDADARLLFSDVVVAVSESTGARLRAAGVRRVEVIRPGVADLDVRPDAVAALRSRLGATGRPLVVYSGDYEYSRAHDVILDAVPRWVALVPDVLVVFACRHKTDAARHIQQEVAARLAREGLSAHVTLLASVPDLHVLLAAADVVVFPVQSLHHKMDIPLTLLEAMLLRRPVVVSDLGPLRELQPDRTGAAVAPGDADALADAVAALLASEERRAAAGEAGRSLVLQRFRPQDMADAYEALYERL